MLSWSYFVPLQPLAELWKEKNWYWEIHNYIITETHNPLKLIKSSYIKSRICLNARKDDYMMLIGTNYKRLRKIYQDHISNYSNTDWIASSAESDVKMPERMTMMMTLMGDCKNTLVYNQYLVWWVQCLQLRAGGVCSDSVAFSLGDCPAWPVCLACQQNANTVVT